MFSVARAKVLTYRGDHSSTLPFSLEGLVGNGVTLTHAEKVTFVGFCVGRELGDSVL